MNNPGFKAKVGLLPVLGLLYASTCGGPYGVENYVALTGPGLFLLILLVTPWLYGVPAALATAELATHRTVEGGYYRWAKEFLGDFWGYQAGAWSVISSLFDNALYPVLFGEALLHFVPGLSAFERWLAAVAFILLMTFLNHLGIRIAGAAAVALNLFLILPLVWMVVAAFGAARFNPLVPFRAEGAGLWEQIGIGLSLTMWLYAGYFEVSTVAEEIDRPTRNIPRALLIVTPLVILSYAAPTLAGLAAVGDWQNWKSGHFTVIGEALGGPLLGQWAFLASAASYIVIFMTYLLWWSRLVWAMSTDGHLPAFLAHLHPRHGTPHRILWIYAAAYCGLVALPFHDLLVVDQWLAGAYTLMTQLAFLRARLSGATAAAGFRVPGGRPVAWAVALVPGIVWVLLLLTTGREHWVLGTITLLIGPALYGLHRLVRGGRAAAPIPR